MIEALYPCFRHWSEKGGVLKRVNDIHRIIIDNAVLRRVEEND